jgi:hypothetical protein
MNALLEVTAFRPNPRPLRVRGLALALVGAVLVRPLGFAEKKFLAPGVGALSSDIKHLAIDGL